MDVDALTRARTARWARLDELVSRRRTTGAEVDELVRLYQATSTDLSVMRSSASGAAEVAQLSQRVARARARLAGTHDFSLADVRAFVVERLPAVLFRLRWWTVAVMSAFVVVAVVAGWWVATNDDALAAMGTPAQQREYVERSFAEYYDPGAGFAAMVWTNNAWVSALCVALGVTGVGVVAVQLSNAISVGATGGMMAAHGSLDVFLQLIAPHGLLELTAVFVAGAAGLRLFWAWVDPGPRPRGRALAEEGRSLVTVVVGLVGVLAVSGVVEGFVTGSSLPSVVKILVGALVLAAFWTYTLVLGRRAHARGETGDLEEDRAGYVEATSA